MARQRVQKIGASSPPGLRASRAAGGDGWSLHQGDCLKLLPQLEEQSVDLLFADPPYFLSNGGSTCKSGRRAPVGKGLWDASRGVEDDHAFNRAWLQECQRILRPTGSMWISGTHHVIFSVGFALQQLGFRILNTVTWYKPNAAPNLSCRYFTHSTELLLWAAPDDGKRRRHTFNYREMKAENGGKQMRDVWALPKSGEEELSDDALGRLWTLPTPRKSEKALGGHPTQKPRALLERIVEASSAPGELVLDPFNGSGTTGVAAVSLGRRYVGLELNPEYLELSARRIEEAATVRSAA